MRSIKCNSFQLLKLRIEKKKKSNLQSQPLNKKSEKMLKSKNSKNILRIEMGVIAPALHQIQIKLNYAHECSQIITSSYGKAKGFSLQAAMAYGRRQCRSTYGLWQSQQF